MRDRRLLIVAVAVAVVFSGAWLWRAAGDGVTDRVEVAEGATATVNPVTYRLESLRADDRVPSGTDDTIVAIRGARLVTARVSYDATASTEPVHCSLELVAGDATWSPDFAWIPPEGEVASCDIGSSGTVSAVFEVPQGFLARVQGVEIANPEGASPLLLGRAG